MFSEADFQNFGTKVENIASKNKKFQVLNNIKNRLKFCFHRKSFRFRSRAITASENGGSIKGTDGETQMTNFVNTVIASNIWCVVMFGSDGEVQDMLKIWWDRTHALMTATQLQHTAVFMGDMFVSAGWSVEYPIYLGYGVHAISGKAQGKNFDAYKQYWEQNTGSMQIPELLEDKICGDNQDSTCETFALREANRFKWGSLNGENGETFPDTSCWASGADPWVNQDYSGFSYQDACAETNMLASKKGYVFNTATNECFGLDEACTETHDSDHNYVTFGTDGAADVEVAGKRCWADAAAAPAATTMSDDIFLEICQDKAASLFERAVVYHASSKKCWILSKFCEDESEFGSGTGDKQTLAGYTYMRFGYSQLKSYTCTGYTPYAYDAMVVYAAAFDFLLEQNKRYQEIANQGDTYVESCAVYAKAMGYPGYIVKVGDVEKQCFVLSETCEVSAHQEKVG